MNKLKVSKKTIVLGLFIAYAAGMLIVVSIWGFVNLRSLQAGRSRAGEPSLQEKCKLPEYGNLPICNAMTFAETDSSNLVKNGNFEYPVLSNSDWLVPPHAAGFVWQAEKASDQSEAGVEVRHEQAASGKQYVEIDSYDDATNVGSLISIKQTLVTAIDHNYTLSFQLASGISSPSEEACLEVLVDGKQITKINGGDSPLSWQKFSYPIKAASSSTTLSFVGCGKENGVGAALDDVSFVEQK